MESLKNLQSLCIESIIDNIDQFCAAYRQTENGLLQYYFEFLQRKYADEVLMKLVYEKGLRNEYLDLVINKYIRDLDFRIFQGNCDHILVIERLKNIGDGIIKMSFAGVENWQTLDKILCCLTSAEVIELQHSKCSDDSLKIIAENCLNVKRLNLAGCTRITDRGLSMLCNCTSLQSLNIESPSVSHKGVAYLLTKVPSLQILDYENVPQAIVEAAGLNGGKKDSETVYQGKFNLTSIDIYHNPFRPENHLTHILQVCADFCPNIKDLCVSDLVTEAQLAVCSSFLNLERVSFSCCSIGDSCINNFLRVTGANLTTLRLTSFYLSVEVIAHYCPKLEHLTLENPVFEPLSDTGVNNLSFPSLKSLNMKKISGEDDIVAFLVSASPNLEVFAFCHSFLSEFINNAIVKSTAELKVINFSSSIVDMVLLQQILRAHDTLEKLIIDNVNITTTQYDTLLDLADDLDLKTDIVWTDFSEVFKSLFHDAYSIPRQILKL